LSSACELDSQNKISSTSRTAKVFLAVPVPVVGVFPPVREAITRSSTKEVAILGVRSMIDSQAMRTFADAHRDPQSSVHLINASPLVDLVETFAFVNKPENTQNVVTDFIAHIRNDRPNVNVMTLSSTHLPYVKVRIVTAPLHCWARLMTGSQPGLSHEAASASNRASV
jgi:glutamate racemase